MESLGPFILPNKSSLDKQEEAFRTSPSMAKMLITEPVDDDQSTGYPGGSVTNRIYNESSMPSLTQTNPAYYPSTAILSCLSPVPSPSDPDLNAAIPMVMKAMDNWKQETHNPSIKRKNKIV
jgi:hypothetical protein